MGATNSKFRLFLDFGSRTTIEYSALHWLRMSVLKKIDNGDNTHFSIVRFIL